MEKRALVGLILASLLVQNAKAGSAVAIGSNGHLVYSYGLPRSVAARHAINVCIHRGGVNVRLLASTDMVGEGAIAVARQGNGNGWLIGVSLGRPTAVDAQARAIEQCRKAGGTGPKVKWGFRG